MTISRERKPLNMPTAGESSLVPGEAARAARLAPITMEGVVIVGSGGNPLVDGFPRLISINE